MSLRESASPLWISLERTGNVFFAHITANQPWRLLVALLTLLIFSIHKWTLTRRTTPLVGRGLFRLSSLASLRLMRELFREGYRKYPNSAFCVQVFPFGRVTVLTSPKLIHEMRCAPTDALSFHEVSHAVILPEHTCFGSLSGHPITVIRHAFSRRLEFLLPGIVDEISAVMDGTFKQAGGDWCSIVVYDLAMEITSRVSFFAMVGSPLCHYPELNKLIQSYVKQATKTAFWINIFPPAFHRIVGPIIASRLNCHLKRLQKMITPLIDERRRKLEELGQEWIDKPNDYLMCLIESALPGQNYESSYETIAIRVLQFSFASIHTSVNTISHLLLDLAASPLSVDILREEISEVTGCMGLSKKSMQEMHRTDSFIRESARLNPVGISADRMGSIGLTSLSRFARRTYVFSDDKTIVSKGSVVMACMNAVHRDESVYPKPDTFDPWRFSNLRSQRSDAFRYQYVATSSTYLTFGHGKHACPGRFFADLELKAILCHIVMNYDLKVEDGIRPLNDDLGIGVVPNLAAGIMLRRSKALIT